ncbi:Dbl homology domain-containing protein [Sporodiniella umbellata]|nr:Dbl homology domain-containing protein [Sporodiniella umbellata]
MSYTSVEEKNDDLWRRPSVLSSSSIVTSSSGGEDSLQSLDSFVFESDVSPSDSSFTHVTPFNQWIDDLSIIDDIYQDFNDESEEDNYEKQVADTARNVSQKKLKVEQLCQSEEHIVHDLANFHRFYLAPLLLWAREQANSDLFLKYPQLCSLSAIEDLDEQVLRIMDVHKQFLAEFKERLDMWGPTQFISDIFVSFHGKLSVYEPLLNSYSIIVVTFYTLYSRCQSFVKFLEQCTLKSEKSVREFLYYLKHPIQRLTTYASSLTHLLSVTEPSHPDYRPLTAARDKFAHCEKKQHALIKDRLGHIRTLEASRSVVGCPVTVTSARRLYITGLLTRVDFSDPQSVRDTRTYLLYSDYLFFCQKIKQKSQKLQYKNLINLRNAEVFPLSPHTMHKITNIKKPSTLASVFKRNRAESVSPITAVYGFQLTCHEVVPENSGGTVLPGTDLSGLCPNINLGKHQFVMRTQTEAEQNAWIYLLKKSIRHVSSQKS